MTTGLWITLCALMIAGLSAILGLWLTKDSKKSSSSLFLFSALIAATTTMALFQTYFANRSTAATETNMARMLYKLDQLISESADDFPELQNFIANELSEQSHHSPHIIGNMATQIENDGGQPVYILGKYLPASELKILEKAGWIHPGSGKESITQHAATHHSKRLKELEKKLASAERSAKDLRQERDSLQNQLSSAEQKLALRNAEIKAAEAQLAELRRQAAELEEFLRKKKRGKSTNNAPIWEKG